MGRRRRRPGRPADDGGRARQRRGRVSQDPRRESAAAALHRDLPAQPARREPLFHRKGVQLSPSRHRRVNGGEPRSPSCGRPLAMAVRSGRGSQNATRPLRHFPGERGRARRASLGEGSATRGKKKMGRGVYRSHTHTHQHTHAHGCKIIKPPAHVTEMPR